MKTIASLAATIRQRGYWDIVVRPGRFCADLIPVDELTSVVGHAALIHHKWGGFPIYDPNQIERSTDWIGSGFAGDVIRQAWRFYCSGQFEAQYALFEDWRDQSRLLPVGANWSWGTTFPMIQAVVQITYAYEFASRLTQQLSRYSVPAVSIEVTFHGIGNRMLSSGDPSRMPFVQQYKSPSSDIPHVEVLASNDIIANWQSLSQNCAVVLFRRFGWNTTPAMMEDVQRRSYFP